MPDTMTNDKAIERYERTVESRVDRSERLFDNDPTHVQIERAEKKLARLLAKRAERWVTDHWFWCECGKTKTVLRADDRIRCQECPLPPVEVGS